MERIIKDDPETNDFDGNMALQLLIPDIHPTEMQNLVDKCQSSWIHHSPLVHNSELIPLFLYWRARFKAEDNVDLQDFERKSLHHTLKNGYPEMLHDMQDDFLNGLCSETIDVNLYDREHFDEETLQIMEGQLPE